MTSYFLYLHLKSTVRSRGVHNTINGLGKGRGGGYIDIDNSLDLTGQPRVSYIVVTYIGEYTRIATIMGGEIFYNFSYYVS